MTERWFAITVVRLRLLVWHASSAAETPLSVGAGGCGLGSGGFGGFGGGGEGFGCFATTAVT